MSKFLGPIHYWLYEKIKFQNKLNKHLCNEELEVEINKLGKITGEDLEKIIDTDNIHGFLQELVNIVEKSYFLIISTRLKTENLEIIEKEIFDFGKENSLEEKLPNDIFNRLNNYLLDGMPCDRSIEILDNQETQLTYKVDNDTHEKFWLNGHEYLYFQLRNQLINGMISNSGLTHKILSENTFIIERK